MNFRYDERNQTKDEANPIRGSVENNNTIDEVVAKPRSMWITCNELKQFSEDNGVSMLIMDCRPRGEFSASRLVYKEYFNVPEEIIKRGYGFVYNLCSTCPNHFKPFLDCRQNG